MNNVPALTVDAAAEADKAEHPIFDALIAEAKNASVDTFVAEEDLDGQRPLTAEEIAKADAWLDRLDGEDEEPAAQAQIGRTARRPSGRRRK